MKRTNRELTPENLSRMAQNYQISYQQALEDYCKYYFIPEARKNIFAAAANGCYSATISMKRNKYSSTVAYGMMSLSIDDIRTYMVNYFKEKGFRVDNNLENKYYFEIFWDELKKSSC